MHMAAPARPASVTELRPYLGGDANVFASAFSVQMLGLNADSVEALSDIILCPARC